MNKAYAAIAAYLAFFYLLSYVNIYICLIYQRQGNDDYIAVEVRILGGLILYKMKVPVIRITEQDVSWFVSEVGTDKERAKTHPQREKRFLKRFVRFYVNHPQRLRKLLQSIRHYRRLYREYMDCLLGGTTCETFYWRTKVGNEDAAVTAVAVGMLWATKSLMLSSIRRRVIFKTHPCVEISPVYGVSKFETELKCIFRVRIGHVISATTLLVNMNRKEAVNRV